MCFQGPQCYKQLGSIRLIDIASSIKVESVLVGCTKDKNNAGTNYIFRKRNFVILLQSRSEFPYCFVYLLI